MIVGSLLRWQRLLKGHSLFLFLAQSMVEGTKGLVQLIKELRKMYHPVSAAQWSEVRWLCQFLDFARNSQKWETGLKLYFNSTKLQRRNNPTRRRLSLSPGIWDVGLENIKSSLVSNQDAQASLVIRPNTRRRHNEKKKRICKIDSSS